VVIHWDNHQIPFIEAEEDEDLAVGLGLVHAHLRLGQLEMMRRIAQGRISEVIGSAGIDLDYLMRTLDVGRAASETLVKMPAETRRWLDAFVRGLNHYVTRTKALPPEFELFDLGREPWSVADIVTLGRLASADVNWLVWFRLRRFRHDPDWPRLWRRICEHDALARSIEDGKTEAPPNYSYGTPD
jgi:penicillin amidase